MVVRKRKIIDKIEVLLKTGDLSTTKLEFPKASAELKGNYLLVTVREEGAITTKIFDINEVSAFKEYYHITNK